MCGGSAGREGAALQMGGSIGWNLGTLLRLKDHDRRTATDVYKRQVMASSGTIRR